MLDDLEPSVTFEHEPGCTPADGGANHLRLTICYPPISTQRKYDALGIDGCPIHNSPMDRMYYKRADYSVVVKNRAPPPKPWRWEIYRAGNANPIKHSATYFDTTAAARGGKRCP